MKTPRRAVVLGLAMSSIIALVLLAALAVWSTTTRLEPAEQAALVTAPDVIAHLDGEFERVQRQFARRRTRGGGVELSYDGLSRRKLRVKSWARMEPTPEAAARTYSAWAKNGIVNAGFEATSWETRPCAFTLALGDEASCLVLSEKDGDAGMLLVVRAKERLLMALIIGAWFDDGEELEGLLAPHLEALEQLKPMSIFD